MKLLELRLAAYGPFTDERLDLSAGHQGLHLIYGPNEAGKSSALRGLKALLFGMGHQTTDNFVHRYVDLRVAGRLRDSDDTELELVRFKRRKNSLLSPQGEPVDEALLARFLGGVGPELFNGLFGIDHATLVRGSKEILQQEGQLGQMLFAAGLGLTGLRRVLEQLNAEAEQIFLPRGKRPDLNEARTHYQRIRQQITDASLATHVWQKHEQTAQQARREREQAERELSALRAEQSRLQRLSRALPRVAERQALGAQRAQLGEVTPVTDDFGERVRQTNQGLRTVLQNQSKQRSKLAQLGEVLEQEPVASELLEHADSIESLHQRLAVHLKAATDRPDLVARRNQLQLAALAQLRTLRPAVELADAESLRPDPKNRRVIRRLAERLPAIEQQQRQLNGQQQQVERNLAHTERQIAELSELPPPEALRAVVEEVRKEGDLDSALQQSTEQQRLQQRLVTAALHGLGLWQGPLDQLAGLPVPARESVDRFEKHYREFTAAARQHESESERVAERLAALTGQLAELQLAGSVPTEQELVQARQRRDDRWRLVRQSWLTNDDCSAEMSDNSTQPATAVENGVDEQLLAEQLAVAFERDIATVDAVSDRLRREAERVQQQASLLARQTDLQQQLTGLEAQAADLERRKRQLDEQWVSLWQACDIEPLPPVEMRAWLTKYERLRDQAERLGELSDQVASLGDRIGQYRQLLGRQIRAIDASREQFGTAGEHETPEQRAGGLLGPRLSQAEAVLATIDEARQRLGTLSRQREELREQLADTQRDQARVAGSLSTWRTEWTDALAHLGMGGDTAPPEVHEALERLGNAFSQLDEAAGLSQRIVHIDESAAEYAVEVQQFAARLTGDLKVEHPESTEPVEPYVAQLKARLVQARQRDSRRKVIQEQLEQCHAELREAAAAAQALESSLADQCREERVSTLTN